ncbi:hypothetical protein [Streptomyces chartreusis]
MLIGTLADHALNQATMDGTTQRIYFSGLCDHRFPWIDEEAAE